MKNRTLITIGIIVILSAAVVIKKYGCSGSVSELEGWYEPCDMIIIKSRDKTLTLSRKESLWFINDQGYPGDAGLIESLERKARDFKLLDLVSEKDYYDRYDLTQEKGVSVTVMGKGNVLRKILIGKTGSTGNHSYITVEGRRGIFLASGISQRDFMQHAADLRDKTVFSVKTPDVKSFSISYGGKTYSFSLNQAAGVTQPEDQKNSGGKDEPKKGDGKPGWVCSGYQNIKLDDSSINSILSLFSPLKAAEFPENAAKWNAGKSLCRVSLVLADKKIDLEIFSGKDKNMNYALSSESRYIFTLGPWQTERLFIKNIKDLAVK